MKLKGISFMVYAYNVSPFSAFSRNNVRDLCVTTAHMSLFPRHVAHLHLFLYLLCTSKTTSLSCFACLIALGANDLHGTEPFLRS
jgi:hypothetical protein